MFKGSYTASNGSITTTITAVNGALFPQSGLESKLYNKAELKAAGVAGLSDADIDQMFTPDTMTYSISGNTLILGPLTLTKKN